MTVVSKPAARASIDEQRRLADAGAGEDADALPGAERREQVDDADAGLHRLADALPAHGRGRLAIGRERSLALAQGAQVVDRLRPAR